MPNNRGGFTVALSEEEIDRLLTDAAQEDCRCEDDDMGFVGGFSDASEGDEFLFASLNHKSHGVQTLADGITSIGPNRFDIYPNLL